MKKINQTIVPGFILILLLAFSFPACQKESEQKIGEKEVPQAVLQSFASNFPSAKVNEYAKENKKGKTSYEISFIYEGKKLDVLFNESGKIVETEESTLAENLPAKVRETLDNEFANYQIDLAEELKKEQGTFYEVKLTDRNSGKKYEIEFSADGMLLKKEEMKEEEK